MTTRNVIVAAAVCMLLLLGHGFGSEATAGDSRDKQACAEVKSQIRAIQNRMRSGYTASQGVRYEARLRRLREKRRRVCR